MRQLLRLTRIGVIAPMAEATERIAARLTDPEALRKAHIHPLTVLVALRTYASGRSLRGEATWTPVQRIVDALDEAFYASFGAVEPEGKRTLIALDVSGSMSWGQVAGMPLTPREASAALALVLAATEPSTHIIGFTGGGLQYAQAGARRVQVAGVGAYARQVSEVRISPRMRLDDAVREVSDLPFGATDCALPMLYALEKRLEVDTFVVVADNETWAGGIHPHEALARYRMQMGIGAKLAVMATSATSFTIADPSDAGMLDVAGFDATVPALLAAFSRGFAACGARLPGPQRQNARQTPVIVSAIRRCGVTHSLVEQMMADAVEAERLRVASRALLVGAVRRGAAAGMTQREIARAVNRSQPEVARLLRFAPASERGRKLARLRREVIDLASRHGFRDVRVFGSVARGEDGPGSDVDLLAEFPPGASLFQIGEVEAALATLLGERVDLVPEDGLRLHAREAILAEAVAL